MVGGYYMKRYNRRDVKGKGIKMENNKMTVNEFVEIYDKDLSKNKTVAKSAVKIIPYISYGMKINLAQSLVNTVHITDGIVQLNTALEYALYVATVFNTYTNISVKTDNGFDDLDILNSNGLIEFVFSQIPEKELKEFNSVLEFCRNDLMTNHYEIHGFINDLVDRIRNDSQAITVPLAELIGVIKDKIEGVDEETINKAINALADLYPLVNQ